MKRAAKNRIWEVDALRGFLILCVIAVHSVLAVQELLVSFKSPGWFVFLQEHGGILFVLLSGLSATLGSHSFRRGLIVFCGGLILTLGSYIAADLGILDADLVIHFGILHCLGFCMMVWPLLKKLPTPFLAVLGAVIIAVGYWFDSFYIKTGYFYALGLCTRSFASGDFYPIFPHLGWFCFGAVAGRLLYPSKQTRFSKVKADCLLLRFLQFCGRHSLLIFLAHLPVVYGILTLIGILI